MGKIRQGGTGIGLQAVRTHVRAICSGSRHVRAIEVDEEDDERCRLERLHARWLQWRSHEGVRLRHDHNHHAQRSSDRGGIARRVASRRPKWLRLMIDACMWRVLSSQALLCWIRGYGGGSVVLIKS